MTEIPTQKKKKKSPFPDAGPNILDPESSEDPQVPNDVYSPEA